MLQEVTLKKDKNAIFAKRLKRYVSIVYKLRRFPSMKLKNMQDIGGCRGIVADKKKLMKVVRDLKKMPEFKNHHGKIRHKDYIKTPKDDGYRGYHLIGRFPNSNGEERNIEIQLRTRLQHYWATALEIVDLFTGQALKSNQGEDNWKSFFYNVGGQFSAMENIHLFSTLPPQQQFNLYVAALNASSDNIVASESIQYFCRKLNVIKKLEFFAASLNVIDNRIDGAPDSGYVLLKIDTVKNTVSSALFGKKDSKFAEAQYMATEKEFAEKSEMVVALVSTTAVGGIKEAYPNYFADSSEFIKYLIYINESNNSNSFLNKLFGKLVS
jgi:hypothetical protein